MGCHELSIWRQVVQIFGVDIVQGKPDLDIAVTPDLSVVPKKLTKRQRLFVEYYLQYWDAQKAALAAGYSATTAKAKSYKFVKDCVVGPAIEWRIKEASLKADEVLARLSQQATANIAEFLDVLETVDLVTGKDIQVTTLNWQTIQDKGFLIKKIEATKDGFKIELYDAQNALIKMGQYHKLFVEKTENTNYNVDITADDLAKARDAAEQYEKDLLGE